MLRMIEITCRQNTMAVLAVDGPLLQSHLTVLIARGGCSGTTDNAVWQGRAGLHHTPAIRSTLSALLDPDQFHSHAASQRRRGQAAVGGWAADVDMQATLGQYRLR